MADTTTTQGASAQATTKMEEKGRPNRGRGTGSGRSINTNTANTSAGKSTNDQGDGSESSKGQTQTLKGQDGDSGEGSRGTRRNPNQNQRGQGSRPNQNQGQNRQQWAGGVTDSVKEGGGGGRGGAPGGGRRGGSPAPGSGSATGGGRGAGRRGAKFNPGLTEGAASPAPSSSSAAPSKTTTQEPSGASTTTTTTTNTRLRTKRNRYKNDSTSTPSTTNDSGYGSVSGAGTRTGTPHADAASLEGDDLASTLARGLRTPPYPDCPICYLPIHPLQRTWSCSPSIPIIPPPGESTVTDGAEQEYCWTTFHTKCIGEWAVTSVKAMADAWRARGEEGKKGDWRCPGCQGRREVVPSGYWCFCGSTSDPKPPRIAIPHSCGSPCSRVRASGCGHACPLNCHPGPCPPCQVTTRLQCYCPRQKVIAFRCGLDKRLSRGHLVGGEGGGGGGGGGGGKRNLSCGEICGRLLGCGSHTCERTCHEGYCGECEVKEEVRCFCGRERKEVGCGLGEKKMCRDEEKGERWEGRWRCERLCERLHDCSTHACSQPCHPPHAPTACPLSPDKITHCPCGTCPIARSPNDPLLSSSPSQPRTKIFPARLKCTSPIPTCKSTCNKYLSGCGHQCSATCHTDDCPPCTVPLVRPCRCGATTKSIRCYQLRAVEKGEEKEVEILCDKPCPALRACGKHQCRRLCCPLAALATSTSGKKGKKRAGGGSGAGGLGGGVGGDGQSGVGEESGGLHECDFVCGKPLSCGLHKCEEKDHKGFCGPCLRSSFEELICFCGRTILEPPIPCGTTIRGLCTYPCPLPSPSCGHPKVPHACHEEPSYCPPCPHLTTKTCACGKKEMTNQRCSLEREKVSCGEKCGKLLRCGWHVCERGCHMGECGDCGKVCGKARRLCFPAHHPCTQPCHAPASCNEEIPCTSLITLTCPCGRIQRSVSCGRSTSSPSGPSLLHSTQTPKCTTECSIAERNARLAAALGVTKESRERVLSGDVKYSDEVVRFAKEEPRFLGLVEKAFEEFVLGSGSAGGGGGVKKPAQILPNMPVERRKFVNDLAMLYRLDTQILDQDPHRSVRIIRRSDTRIPHPTLSAHIASTSGPSLGKLADLRSTSASPAWRASPVSGVGVGGSLATRIGGASPGPAASPARVGTPTQRPTWGAVTPASSLRATPIPTAAAAGTIENKSRPHTPAVIPQALPVVESSATPPVDVPDDWEDEA